MNPAPSKYLAIRKAQGLKQMNKKEEKPFTFTRFLANYSAGYVVGGYLGKLIAWGLLAWILYSAFHK